MHGTPKISNEEFYALSGLSISNDSDSEHGTLSF